MHSAASCVTFPKAHRRILDEDDIPEVCTTFMNMGLDVQPLCSKCRADFRDVIFIQYKSSSAFFTSAVPPVLQACELLSCIHLSQEQPEEIGTD